MSSNYRAKKRDALGSRTGTVAAKVNKVMTTKWQTLGEIQEKVRAGKRSVARRLYNGVEKGIYEYERIIRFKLKRKAK